MLSKLALYASVIVGFVLLERMANLESQLAVIAICTLICLVELWSMGGSALIVNPKMRFLRIFREVLAGRSPARCRSRSTRLKSIWTAAQEN